MPKKSDFDFDFVNHTLTEKQKATLKADVWDLEKTETALLRLVDEGYKISVSWDDRGECYTASITRKKTAPENPENDKKILMGRGSTPIKAMKQAIFIHYVIFKCSWPVDNRPQRFDPDSD